MGGLSDSGRGEDRSGGDDSGGAYGRFGTGGGFGSGDYFNPASYGGVTGGANPQGEALDPSINSLQQLLQQIDLVNPQPGSRGYPSGVVVGPYELPPAGPAAGGDTLSPQDRQLAPEPVSSRGMRLGDLFSMSAMAGEGGDRGGGYNTDYFDRTFSGVPGGGGGGGSDPFGGYEGTIGSNRNMPRDLDYQPATDASFIPPENRGYDKGAATQYKSYRARAAYPGREQVGSVRDFQGSHEKHRTEYDA